MTKKESVCMCGPRMERFLEPCLLILLHEKETYGYKLIESLAELGFGDNPDPGMVYRNLRKLEKEKAVTSNWDTANPGPARRVYKLTPAGRQAIHQWSKHVQQKINRLQSFLKRYNQNFPEGSEGIV